MAEHCVTKNHTIGELFGGDAATRWTCVVVACIFTSFGIAAEVGMALRTEPIESAAHVDFSLSAVMSKSVRSIVEPRV